MSLNKTEFIKRKRQYKQNWSIENTESFYVLAGVY